jgi:hypothetical protein
MKKICPLCERPYSGRSDKLFCSIECKNNHHNSLRKQGVVNMINQSLHQNRTVLFHLLHAGTNTETVERVVLERLGFQFELMTGVSNKSNGHICWKVYEFEWSELPDGSIRIERTDLVQPNVYASVL